MYRVWLVAKDSLDNEQTTLSIVTVKTVRTTPPVYQELLVQYNAPSSVYVEVIFAACIMQLLMKQLLLFYEIIVASRSSGRG